MPYSIVYTLGGSSIVAVPGTAENGGPEYVPTADHAAEAAKLLLSQHDGKARMHALLAALMAPVQDFEDAAAALYSAFDLDSAVGAQLDVIGGIVGEPRNGREDDAYRPYVQARIAANTSRGRADDLYRITRLVIGDAGGHTLRFERDPPAGYSLYVEGADLAYPWDATISADVVGAALAEVLLAGTSGGISFALLYQHADDANTFTLSSGDTEEVDPLAGLADDEDTDPGGVLAGVEGRG